MAKSTLPRHTTCVDCGVSFVVRCGNHKRCDGCALKNLRMHQKRWTVAHPEFLAVVNERERERTRERLSKVACRYCGKTGFAKTAKRQICDDCYPIYVRDYEAACGRRAWHRGITHIPCVLCGTQTPKKAENHRYCPNCRKNVTGYYLARWRSQKRGSDINHTFEEWRELCAHHKFRCAYCGKETRLTRDHAIPLSRGGTDDITNIRPCCQSCNSRKNDKTEAEFFKWKDAA